MLVLSRRVGESVRIAGGITITVRHVGGSRVRLAIEAPAETKILRGELEQRETEILGELELLEGTA